MGMLLLERKVDQLIEIQVEGIEPILVAIKGINGKKVTVGIIAPNDVTIHRQEIADKIRKKGEKGNLK